MSSGPLKPSSANKKKVVFDLSGLNYLDSTGIGIIVMCSGKMKAAGELRLASLQPRIAELMKITKIDQIMHLYPTAAAAVENFCLAEQDLESI